MIAQELRRAQQGMASGGEAAGGSGAAAADGGGGGDGGAAAAASCSACSSSSSASSPRCVMRAATAGSAAKELATAREQAELALLHYQSDRASMAAQLRALKAQLQEQQEASTGLEAQLQEHRALALRLKAEHANQLRAEHVRLHEQRPQRAGHPPPHLRREAGAHAAPAGDAEQDTGHAHTVDMPGHGGGGEAQRQAGMPRAARLAFGFTQTRASIWSPIWSLLAGLANVGRSRSHQLMSV
jgi:hypothetical protein